VQAICQIGDTMGLSIVAEYDGDQATVDMLKEIGVDFLQGFFVGKPVALTEITDRLRSEAQAASA
jgi:EAL domain-containing protein (putative c-di-GMP-specific phosphodiesterase class I)